MRLNNRIPTRLVDRRPLTTDLSYPAGPAVFVAAKTDRNHAIVFEDLVSVVRRMNLPGAGVIVSALFVHSLASFRVQADEIASPTRNLPNSLGNDAQRFRKVTARFTQMSECLVLAQEYACAGRAA